MGCGILLPFIIIEAGRPGGAGLEGIGFGGRGLTSGIGIGEPRLFPKADIVLLFQLRTRKKDPTFTLNPKPLTLGFWAKFGAQGTGLGLQVGGLYAVLMGVPTPHPRGIIKIGVDHVWECPWLFRKNMFPGKDVVD